jgi:predicted Fe-Mo cluster-binding NifX family protein
MIIAIPSRSNKGLDDEINEHFGRSFYYTFVNIKNNEIKEFEVKSASFSEHKPGQIPEWIKQNGAECIICWGMGRRAQEWFEKLGIKVIMGACGKIKDVIEDYIKGNLKSQDWKCNKEDKK